MKKALLDLKMEQVMKAVCDVAGLTKEQDIYISTKFVKITRTCMIIV